MPARNDDKQKWLPFVFIGLGVITGFPLLIIGGIAMLIKQSKDNGGSTYRTTTTTTTRKGGYNSEDLLKVNKKLRRYFASHVSLPCINDINLRLKGNQYTSLSSLNVYKGDSYICSLNEFGTRYKEVYNKLINLLIVFADQPDVEVQPTVAPAPQPKVEEAPKEEVKQPKKTAQPFIDQINSLNIEIPDEDITNGLYETCALLKQIGNIEDKMPESGAKLEKLYDYYLPILLNILNQFKDLQLAQTSASFETSRDKLNKTIILINDAMKTILAGLCEDDFINLSADMSTLEALLKKDGLTKEGVMKR
ncbi:MAG: hypothetical protein HUJ57_01140 [Erysipelotrichaceae bacterium]|mgnify:CR=1 FL=1|nr:hypothetical protein [Erysipelotrichaceae bacterium]